MQQISSIYIFSYHTLDASSCVDFAKPCLASQSSKTRRASCGLLHYWFEPFMSGIDWGGFFHRGPERDRWCPYDKPGPGYTPRPRDRANHGKTNYLCFGVNHANHKKIKSINVSMVVRIKIAPSPGRCLDSTGVSPGPKPRSIPDSSVSRVTILIIRCRELQFAIATK